MCPMNIALMSFLGSSLGQRLNASYAASLKISLASKPSRLPNLDMPALIMLTSGFPFKPHVPLNGYTFMPVQNKNHIVALPYVPVSLLEIQVICNRCTTVTFTYELSKLLY